MKTEQAASAVVMVRPKIFGFNPQTEGTNGFQQAPGADDPSIAQRALEEFDRMVDLLRSNDIHVLVVDDTAEPAKPDAVFPNNWVSFHHDGTVVLYPMMAVNRRLERTNAVVERVQQNFLMGETFDLTSHEKQGKFLEGTGSIVFDYANRLAYACRSPRTDESVLEELTQKLGFDRIVFDAVDESGQAIYHTNVVLCIGTDFVLICLDAVEKEEDQEKLLRSFSQAGHQVIAISYAQMKEFAGNMLEVKTRSGERFVVLSQRAFHALLPGQLDALSQRAELIPVAVPTIETYGGGSVRCMMAGIFSRSQQSEPAR